MTATRQPFADGIASGDPTATSIVLWTRVDPASTRRSRGTFEVGWEIGTGGSVERSGVAVADRSTDHCVHVLVEDLLPATTYRYAFEIEGHRAEGMTRTLPSSGADRLRFAVACCSRWGWPGFDLFDSIAAAEPDVLMFLGDAIYEVGERPPDGPTTDPPHECLTLDDYRRRYRQHRTHPAFRRMLTSLPLIATWDDHEVVDNAPDPSQERRRLAGQRAWSEWMPMRRDDDGGDRAGGFRPIQRAWSIGGLVDVALIDARFGGRTPSTVDGPGVHGDAPGAILDERQWTDLESFAARTSAPWFVLANQVQVSPMTLALRPALAWPPWRRVVNPDQWDGYPADRERLTRVLDRVPGRPVVLSGDLHSGWSRALLADGDRVAHEFTSPSISGLTYAEAVRGRLPIPTTALARWLRLLNPGIDHLDLRRHGYLVCDVSPERFHTTFVTADGARHDVVLDA